MAHVHMAMPMVPPRERMEIMMPVATAIRLGDTESCPAASRATSVMLRPKPMSTGYPQTSFLVWAFVVDMQAKKAMKMRNARTVIHRSFLAFVQ